MIKTLKHTALALSLMSVSLFASNVIVNVNGKSVTEAEIAAVIGQMGVNIQQVPADMKKLLIEQYVDKILIQDDVLKDDKIIKDPVFISEVTAVKRDIAFRHWIKKVYDGIKVSDEEITKYYDANKAKFSLKDEYKARHILLKTEKEAKELITKLSSAKETEKTFIELAKKHSTGPSGVQGGELGWFSADKMVPEFSASTKTLSKGSFSKTPVKTQFGFHIIYLEDKKEGKEKPLKEVNAEVKKTLMDVKLKEIIDTKSKTLRKSAKIEYTKKK